MTPRQSAMASAPVQLKSTATDPSRAPVSWLATCCWSEANGSNRYCCTQARRIRVKRPITQAASVKSKRPADTGCRRWFPEVGSGWLEGIRIPPELRHRTTARICFFFRRSRAPRQPPDAHLVGAE